MRNKEEILCQFMKTKAKQLQIFDNGHHFHKAFTQVYKGKFKIEIGQDEVQALHHVCVCVYIYIYIYIYIRGVSSWCSG